MTGFTPRIKELDRTSEKDHLKLGYALKKEGRFEEAVSNFKEVLRTEPRSIPARIALGNIYFKMRNYDEALKWFQEVIQLDPLMPKAALKAGNVYLRQGNLDKALEQFENFLNLAPKSQSIEAHLNIARVLLRQKKYEAAIQQFYQALSFNPQDTSIRVAIAKAYKNQGKLEEAISELRLAHNINPTLWNSHAVLGSIYLEQEEYGAARDAFEQALNLNPKAPAAKFGLTEALIAEDQLEEATQILRKMSEREDVAPRKHKLFGDIYYRQNFFKEAIQEYRATILLTSKEADSRDGIENLNELVGQDSSKLKELADTYRTSAARALQNENLNYKEASLATAVSGSNG